MTKKEYWERVNRKQDIKQHKEYKQEKKRQDNITQHNAIVEEVFKGNNNNISNYGELQLMNSNVWKNARHINNTRMSLNDIIPTNEKQCENIVTKCQNLAKLIDRFNNRKNAESWEKLQFTMQEYELIETLNAYKEVVENENISITEKQNAMYRYIDKMNKLCDSLMKKYHLK